MWRERSDDVIKLAAIVVGLTSLTVVLLVIKVMY